MWLSRCESCDRLVERVWLDTQNPVLCNDCREKRETVCPVCNDRAPWCPDLRKEVR